MKANHGLLGDSRSTALKRLHQVERRLARDSFLKQHYINFMQEYRRLHHMELVEDSNLTTDKAMICYLPHHAIVKKHSTTTKIRVVFDGSSKSSSGIALNDLLLVGPTIQEDLFSIVVRFRSHRYVLTADIVKMYRQVWMHPEHADLQRILWREDTNQPVRTYRLSTVTYGTASAPFLATRCLQQLAKEERLEHPEAADIITRDFYVDDLLTGADSLENIVHIKDDISTVLFKGGFEMHKWNSNCSELRDQQGNQVAAPSSTLTKQDRPRTLGLLWDADRDCLSFQAKDLLCASSYTKRRILSLISAIFDPLGLLGPFIIVAKLLVQQLWQLKIGWDEAVPQVIFTQWQRYELELKDLNGISVPRNVINAPAINTVQMHGFCDASEAAYGACIYLRSTSDTGEITTHLLCAKSRVAPLKTISVPRLELCGALLLAQLAARATVALNRVIQQHHFWTDSTVTLSWIQSSPHLWKTFIANRTSEIQELTNNGQWHYVNTRENPADVLSRGATIRDLIQQSSWWHGPAWLKEDQHTWLLNDQPGQTDGFIPEAKTAVIALISVQEQYPLFNRYSSLATLTKVIAYCLRFKTNCLNPTNRLNGTLLPHERRRALTCLIKLAQMEVFAMEIHQLLIKKQVHPRSKLLPLKPFLDSHGVLRVGGRLSHAQIAPEQIHPAILPTKHPLTVLVISHEHKRHLHAGLQATLAAVRLRFWPLSGREATKRVLRTCITCFRVHPVSLQPQMGDLPAGRVNPSRPFSVSGVDFCGPFRVREGGRRSKKTVKAYVAIFVCFATRAAHLELVGDLTTAAFIGALKRFISRRGKCIHISSDNATNFMGANRELQELKALFTSDLHQHQLTTFLAEEEIVWEFIPANSPHFGGLWEAGVKSSKHHLRRVLGNSTLSFEELTTVLAQVEACLNSRPLTPLSSDPTDLSYLTPGHFLIGEPLTAIGEPSLMDLQINRLSRWQRLQQMFQHFWSRWSREYLSQLQVRHKWKRPTVPITVGSMVLLREDHTPPLQWPIGRITIVHPGKDGIVRVVTVRTRTGTFKRAVSKVCVFPLEDSSQTTSSV